VIALDTSAIVAIVYDEEDGRVFNELIVSRTAIVGTPTLLEAHMVLSKKLEGGAEDFFEQFLRTRKVRPVAFSLNMFQLAQEAFDAFGKGRHPKAALNYGDCMAYAVAKYHSVPLLYKGKDFLYTDIEAAVRLPHADL
jgi:ribonuclease VapC